MVNKKENFFKLIGDVSDCWNKYGILPSVVLAQAILESGWGTSQLSTKGFNLFGIKADSSWKGKKIKLPTTEYKNGKPYKVDAYFRKYDS